jgi:hypothetical protein
MKSVGLYSIVDHRIQIIFTPKKACTSFHFALGVSSLTGGMADPVKLDEQCSLEAHSPQSTPFSLVPAARGW